MTDVVRTFVAVELPQDVLQRISSVLQHLRSLKIRNIRWVRSESVHLTLKFLGEIAVPCLHQIERALCNSVSGQALLRLQPDALGVFPSPSRPRVLWLGLRGDLDALGELQQRVENALSRRGFPSESRAFSPHLTLGRFQRSLSPEDRERLLSALGSMPVPKDLSFQVTGVSLMRSTLTRNGAEYMRSALFPF